MTIVSESDQLVNVSLAGNALLVTAPPGFAVEVVGATCSPVDGQVNSVRCAVAPGSRVTIRTTVAGVARQASPTPAAVAAPVTPATPGVAAVAVVPLPRVGTGAATDQHGNGRWDAVLVGIVLLVVGGVALVRRLASHTR